MQSRPPWLGILGGMGPRATTDFMDKVTRHTEASRDQDHIPMLVVSDPTVPDRTEAICAGGPDPWPYLLRGARLLLSAGVELAVMPCNTAHRWFERLESAIPLRWLHIADAAASDLQRLASRPAVVGLLATSGTIAAKSYQDRLDRIGIPWIVPPPRDQTLLVDGCMRDVKAGKFTEGRAKLLQAESSLHQRGAHSVILACTEFPVALDGLEPPPGCHRVDPTDALARQCVARLKPHPQPPLPAGI